MRPAPRSRVAGARLDGTSVEWVCDDFFSAYDRLKNGRPFDVVLGNPPFIRFQYFNDRRRETAFRHLRDAGYRPTKLANAWAAFVQLSIELLGDDGRLAMVLPAELLQVKYAAELRNSLASRFADVYLVGFRRLVFPNIRQEVVLLLAEGKRSPRPGRVSDIHTAEFQDGEDLLRLGSLDRTVRHLPAKHSEPGMKWTALFLGPEEHKTLVQAGRALGLTRLGEIADTAVGVVTGRNSFFVLSEQTVDELDAWEYVTPIVGKTSALRSTRFTSRDFRRYADSFAAYLLDTRGRPAEEFPGPLRDYLRTGEEEGIHQGYKCRIRPRWFDVPSVYRPDAFLFRQIHTHPLLVANDAGASSTDTIHRVRLKVEADLPQICAAFVNSLTFGWAEVCGRSYGGGVLELEPREADELPLPLPARLELDVDGIDDMLRAGRLVEALDTVDELLLHRLLGFSWATIGSVRRAWAHLRDRRTGRA